MTVQKTVTVACVTRQEGHASINARKDSTETTVIKHAVQTAASKVISVSLRTEHALLRNVLCPGMVLSVKIGAPLTV